MNAAPPDTGRSRRLGRAVALAALALIAACLWWFGRESNSRGMELTALQARKEQLEKLITEFDAVRERHRMNRTMILMVRNGVDKRNIEGSELPDLGKRMALLFLAAKYKNLLSAAEPPSQEYQDARRELAEVAARIGELSEER